ncbi:MAG: MerR family transcriptional regulator [Myxococcales bacterium]|nr:MerR family transcriptional regulator [Myxococcales bacterium]
MPTQLPILQDGPHGAAPTREERVRLSPLVDNRPLVDKPLKVGELAKISGKTVRALHLYEEMGLLVPAERSKGRYRLYDADSVTRVRWIGKLQEMGFSLQEIRTMSEQWEGSGSAPHAMAKVQALFDQKLRETREQIARLRTLEGELQASLRYLCTCPTCDPNQLIEACSSCDQHDGKQQPPELVAGFTAH